MGEAAGQSENAMNVTALKDFRANRPQRDLWELFYDFAREMKAKQESHVFRRARCHF